jgi:hypothetical protein
MTIPVEVDYLNYHRTRSHRRCARLLVGTIDLLSAPATANACTATRAPAARNAAAQAVARWRCPTPSAASCTSTTEQRH